MGGLVSQAEGFVLDVASAANTADRLSGYSRRQELRAEQDLVMKRLREQQSLDEQKAAEEAALKREEIQTRASLDESDRRNALRRAVARQRARLGASGIAASEGSGEAILLGLFEESDDLREEREKIDRLRLAEVETDLGQIERRNILEQTQLAERQRFERSLL